MQRILKASYVYRALASIGAWFGVQWRKSLIIGRFLSPKWVERGSRGSIFYRVWFFFHKALCDVLEKLCLVKLLRGSILTRPYIWSFTALVLAPILPTMAVLALMLICIVSVVLTFGCDRNRKLAYSPINKFTLLFAFVYIAATFTSVSVSGSLLGGALTSLFVLFTLVIQNSVTTKRQLDALVYAFVISGAFVSAYGVFQYLTGATGASAWIDETMFSGIGVRVYSTLGNPNVLSEYLLLVIPFAGACILLAKKAIMKIFYAGCLGAMVLCMLLTFARGGWLGLIVAAAVFLVMLDRRFIIAGIVALVVLYFALPDVILNRFLSIGDVGDSSTSYRVSIWLGTIAMLKDFWFTGIGPGTAAFNKIYPLYSYNTAVAQHSHNLYLQIMCDSGICGIVIFLALLFSYVRNLCCAVSREKDKRSKVLQIASVSSLLGFLIQSATDHSFYNYRVTLVFWAVLGLGALAARRSSLPGCTGELSGITTGEAAYEPDAIPGRAAKEDDSTGRAGAECTEVGSSGAEFAETGSAGAEFAEAGSAGAEFAEAGDAG